MLIVLAEFRDIPPVLSGVRVIQFLVFFVVFYHGVSFCNFDIFKHFLQS